MSKVAGSFDSVVRGVSQQVPQDRRSGQMYEQINMVSDPVHGLTRRRGSVWQDELNLGTAALSTFIGDAAQMQEFSFTIANVDYSLVYRPAASTNDKTTFMFLFNKDTGKFIPITYENSTWVNALISGGVSAVTALGRFLYIAGNTTTPIYSQSDKLNTTANKSKLAAWVRGGAYSRTFSITLTKTDGTKSTYSYKTMASSYPTLLDTSDIPFYKSDGTTPDPAYQKNVNDRVYAYNSQVTAYIGQAAEDITGENIAQKLVDVLVAASIVATRYESTVCIDDSSYVDIAVDDGGDGSLLKGVGLTVESPEDMTLVHYVGKVVQVRPHGSTDDDVYYLVADAANGTDTGWAEVIWREGCGVITTPTGMVAIGTIYNGTLYIAKDGPGLDTATGQPAGTNPSFKPSTVGDGASSPVPYFFGNKITMLSVFQDRLIVGCEGTVNCSRNGDYLNFFRQTCLEIVDDDPIEMYSTGNEGDTLHYTAMYDQSLILFGDSNQYGISGKSTLSARSPLISQISSHENSTATAPKSSGNFVFYGKNAEGRTSLNQLQIGQLIESPVGSEVSQQLDNYIDGVPAQITALTAPNLVFMRTAKQKSTFYCYGYVDSPDGSQRLLDNWGKWQYADALGQIIGISENSGDLLIYTMREAGGDVYVVADSVNLTNTLADKPALDSMRKMSTLTGWHAAVAASDLSVAADNTSPYFLLGTSYDKVGDFTDQLTDLATSQLWVGAVSDGYVEITNPFMRDRNDRAILNARLVLSQFTVSVADTAGLDASVYSVLGTQSTLQFSGRLLGDSSNVIAQQPIYSGTLKPLGVGREVRDCRVRFSTVDWLPATITSLEWTGQYFNRVRRAT